MERRKRALGGDGKVALTSRIPCARLMLRRSLFLVPVWMTIYKIEDLGLGFVCSCLRLGRGCAALG